MINKVESTSSQEYDVEIAKETPAAAKKAAYDAYLSGNTDFALNVTEITGTADIAALFADNAQASVAYRHGRGNPPGRGPGNPPGRGPGNPPGRGPGNPPGRTPPPHYPDHHRHYPHYYRRYDHYPHWHFQVTVFWVDGRYHYRGGPDLSIGSYAGLLREKHAVDAARDDMWDDAYRWGRNSPEFRRDAEAVVFEYGHLLSSVFNYGDRRPGDGDLHGGAYQGAVREIWRSMLDTLQAFERYNPGDRSLRNQAIDALTWAAESSRLSSNSAFYADLLRDIRREKI